MAEIPLDEYGPTADPVPAPVENKNYAAAEERMVKGWTETVVDALKFFEPDFKRMRANMRMARTGAAEGWGDDAYVANIAGRVVAQRTSNLYARNPSVRAKPRKKMRLTTWDGKLASLQRAIEDPEDPTAAAIIEDAARANTDEMFTQRHGETHACLWDYYTREQVPTFKQRMRQAVYRAGVSGVAWAGVNFQDNIDAPNDPLLDAQLQDARDQVQYYKSLQTPEVNDEDGDNEDARLMKAEEAMKSIQEQMQSGVGDRRGPIFEFERADKIVIDPNTTQLRGLVGCQWIARVRSYTKAELKEIFELDVTGDENVKMFNAQDAEGSDLSRVGMPIRNSKKAKEQRVRVFAIQCKKTKREYIVCEGHKKFLQAPKPLPVQIERVFTMYPLVFNDVDDDESIYPNSDIENLKHIQQEWNRARESAREHRIANRPKYVASANVLQGQDLKSLASLPAHHIVELQGLLPGQDISSVLQAIKHAPIDPALYDTSFLTQDILLTTGMQQANLGPTSNSTATEVATAEGSRETSSQAAVDTLDEFLTGLARDFAQVCSMELDLEEVQEVAGMGSVWPEADRMAAYRELVLEIEAGSSGRPNKAQDIANIERVAPILLQTPGIQPDWLADKILKIVFDGEDVMSQAVAHGLPSIAAANAAFGRGTGAAGQAESAAPSSGGADNVGPQDPEAGGSQPGFPV